MKKFIFFDYLKAGMKLNFFIIIDFSEKNLANDNINTNQILQIINCFNEALFEFVISFKKYGNGESLKKENNTNNFFNLSIDLNTEIKGLPKFENKYHDYFSIINSEEKRDLLPIFEHIRKEIYNNYKPDIYNIIFILISNKPNGNSQQKLIENHDNYKLEENSYKNKLKENPYKNKVENNLYKNKVIENPFKNKVIENPYKIKEIENLFLNGVKENSLKNKEIENPYKNKVIENPFKKKKENKNHNFNIRLIINQQILSQIKYILIIFQKMKN